MSTSTASFSSAELPGACLHCGQEISGRNAGFCCSGCEAAYALIRDLGLDAYYARRCIDPDARPIRPDEDAAPADFSAHVSTGADGRAGLHLMVDGLQCAACVWLIETVLRRQPGVTHARLNMTTRRLTVTWDPAVTDAAEVAGAVVRLGYRLVPFDPAKLEAAEASKERELLRALGVSGFAAANVMLLSVAIWAGHAQGMGPATRDLMHWVSALIAMPAILYAARPFVRSAWAALSARRTNMDVPISIGVTLATGMSLAETIRGAEHAYFDSAVTLLFFLLIGRYLDMRARGRARSAAEHLLALGSSAVTVLDGDGRGRVVRPGEVAVGMTVLVAAGERIPVDGRVCDGVSDIDTGLITGESVPGAARVGNQVFAGTLNLTAPLRLTVTAVGEGTLLAEIVRMMEVAEQGRARYVALADRVSRAYAPVVHLTALATFLGWVLLAGSPWQPALLNAIAVLIITCPCALALAVPVVQVIASGRLMRQGILLKSATALERLTGVDTVVFDKTGTLTEGRPELQGTDGAEEDDLRLAAAIAGASRHPLARALCRAVPGVPVAAGVREVPGAGLGFDGPDGETRLGSRRFTGALENGGSEGGGAEAGGAPGESAGPELWLARPGRRPVRFAFSDALRPDAAAVVAALRADGKRVLLLSGDRRPAVAACAARLGIEEWRAAQAPADKAACLEELARSGATVLMVGDGLNDAPALAAAHVSMSPATAADVSQTAADVVFQGIRLTPILESLDVARRSDRLVRQNFALTFLYNLLTIPVAVAGLVTPLIAALAMSSSSLIVILNALRLARRRANPGQSHGRAHISHSPGGGPGTSGPSGLPVVPEVRPV
ncbi:heavy metal translocating P-type ATPase [Skermanella pratensis]|uniref:heavy metal translocating P-type ATPase n=1 Tax=Skermanella pratensis TaxID=2233999 RepID=UPI001300D403|nr:heavy metal translocating P-type ATPase metal-binding domain-containing protein [Skermanella pratensis]